MKTKYKYIEFKKLNDECWWVENHKTGDYLGDVEYNNEWGQWEFLPGHFTGYSHQCLLDLADFVNQLNNAK